MRVNWLLMRRLSVGCITAMSGLTAVFASAAVQPSSARADRGVVFAGLIDCRRITDSAARLACYDHATDELDRAEKTGEVTVIDRDQAKVLRRQAFGFDLPSLTLFARGPKEEEVDHLFVTLDGVSIGRDGRWRMMTSDGATWVQVDDEAPARDPRKGSQLAVRRAALGSYFCNVDGQRAMRCQRQH